jgi:hypothetical protein
MGSLVVVLVLVPRRECRRRKEEEGGGIGNDLEALWGDCVDPPPVEGGADEVGQMDFVDGEDVDFWSS